MQKTSYFLEFYSVTVSFSADCQSYLLVNALRKMNWHTLPCWHHFADLKGDGTDDGGQRKDK